MTGLPTKLSTRFFMCFVSSVKALLTKHIEAYSQD